jgi:drug/metabolite transporter (DMT)-like permease
MTRQGRRIVRAARSSVGVSSESGLARGALAGIFWMTLAGALSACAAGLIRQLGGVYPAIELVFFRNIAGLAVVVPILLHRGGFGGLGTRRLPMYCLRVTFQYLAMVLLFYALANMPIADVFALQFTIPLFSILMAVMFLGQQAGSRSWIACLVGFAGALLVVRPGFEVIGLAALAALGSALMSGGSNTAIKLLSSTDGAVLITGWSNLLMLPFALVPALFVWVTPSWRSAATIAGMAVLHALGGYCFTRSVAAADARIVQPFQFSRMLFAALVGFAMFGELPDAWTWAGAAVIFASAYAVIRQTRR